MSEYEAIKYTVEPVEGDGHLDRVLELSQLGDLGSGLAEALLEEGQLELHGEAGPDREELPHVEGAHAGLAAAPGEGQATRVEGRHLRDSGPVAAEGVAVHRVLGLGLLEEVLEAARVARTEEEGAGVLLEVLLRAVGSGRTVGQRRQGLSVGVGDRDDAIETDLAEDVAAEGARVADHELAAGVLQ